MGNGISIFGIFLIALLFSDTAKAQNQAYARTIIDTLSSASFHGRGYVMQGDSLAAAFIRNEFKKIGLNAYPPGYYQKFNHDINTFPGTMEISVNGTKLKPGADYIVSPYSHGTYGTFKLHRLNDLLEIKPHKLEKFLRKSRDFNFIVIEDGGQKPDELLDLMIAAKKTFGAKGIVLLKEKLTWAVSSHEADLLVIQVLKSTFKAKASTINLNIENKLEKDYQSRNVIAYKDNGHPNSVIVFTAHYDHLGRMGKTTYFPGANDNASGIAMLFDLAQHYQEDSIKYDVAFIAFAGEEAGLVGSKYYTENPLFPLKDIKFLVNLDLMGNGEEGITVVNGTLHEKELALITRLNEQNNFVPLVKKRGKAQNSDHYYFTENDVPAFFIYTLGGNKAYHDIYDISATLEMQKYKEVFQLITSFIKEL